MENEHGEKTFELEGSSLKEARDLAKKKVPVGQKILSEKIICDVKCCTIRGVKEDTQAAFEDVRKQVPSSVVIVKEKILFEPGYKKHLIAADDEQSARTFALKFAIDENDLIKNIKIEKLKRKGFLGIGRRPNLYHVGVLKQAVVEVDFVVKARILVKIGPIPSITQLLESLEYLTMLLQEIWSRLECTPTPFREDPELAFADGMHLTPIFNSLKEKVSVPFNSILADAQCLFSDDSAIQNLQTLNLGPPNSRFDRVQKLKDSMDELYDKNPYGTYKRTKSNWTPDRMSMGMYNIEKREIIKDQLKEAATTITNTIKELKKIDYSEVCSAATEALRNIKSTLTCASCGRTYELMKTGSVITDSVAQGAIASQGTVVIGFEKQKVPVDAVYTTNNSEWTVTKHNMTRKSIEEIRNGMTSGQKRRWNCRACGHEQDYKYIP